MHYLLFVCGYMAYGLHLNANMSRVNEQICIYYNSLPVRVFLLQVQRGKAFFIISGGDTWHDALMLLSVVLPHCMPGLQRKYRNHFISKVNDGLTRKAECQLWKMRINRSTARCAVVFTFNQTSLFQWKKKVSLATSVKPSIRWGAQIIKLTSLWRL